MDPKRRNQTPSTSSITHHPRSAEHQRVGVTKSKTKVGKKPSEVSLTPSQIAEQEKIVGRKNPLDALSKVNVRQTTIERRSGLQEVDEEYLKQNIFRKAQLQRNSGLNEANKSQQQNVTPVHAAGQPSIHQNDNHALNVNPNQAHMQQQQFQQVPPHQQQQHQQINQQSVALENQGNISQSTLQGSQQHQQQIPLTQQQQPQIVVNAHHNHQQQHPHQQQQHQQLSTHHQQTVSPPLNVSSMPEPEMCTTCPNCQTTIYLVPAQTPGQNMQTTFEASSSVVTAPNAQSEPTAASRGTI
ncbi:uncharacterized protein [Musca autumnalis]|uniref:uncharacterized protein n=1 Tax=Musca autumnalis TaxID=221902 RepID=UPI003CECC18A